MYQLTFTPNNEELIYFPITISFQKLRELRQIINELSRFLTDEQFYAIESFDLTDKKKKGATDYTEEVARIWIQEEESQGRDVHEESEVPQFVKDSDALWNHNHIQEGEKSRPYWEDEKSALELRFL
ncbi:hypothetical protein BAnh1_09810 [Bartonella australis AUST/NH1]|uniref:Uncharacterized protein n=1 Tax=Bartonella australis (strain Aust/NH1) TaxID=1094489 RepID=M1NU70_BARAA|nr:hypothetical protein [Bartonella australis]AGF74853.1 hypothetical protein BAnh1_09810 [Bartonella australis AUST/NH1]